MNARVLCHNAVASSALFLIVACNSTSAITASNSRSDSAGITIINSAVPAWENGRKWTLTSEPVLQIGSSEKGDPNYLLYIIRAAYRLSDKRIVVANASTNQIRYFDSSGTFIRNTGREGNGPGEWSQLFLLQRGGGDTLLAVQPTNMHSIISPRGDYIDRFALVPVRNRTNIWGLGKTSSGFIIAYSLSNPGGGLESDTEVPVDTVTSTGTGDVAVGAFAGADGASVGADSALDPDPEGFSRQQFQHFVYDMHGRMIDSIGILPGLGRYREGIAAFLPKGHYAIADDMLYFGTGDKHEVRVYRVDVRPGIKDPAAERTASSGDPLAKLVLQRIIRREPDRSLDVTPAIIEQNKNMERAKAQRFYERSQRPPPSPADMERHLSSIAYPPRFPAQSKLLIDAERNIWEQRYKMPGDSLDTFAVYDPRGTWLGLVDMPARFTPTDIGTDYILGTWRNEVDVEFVRMYTLRK